MSGAWDWGPAEVAAHVARVLPGGGAVGTPRRLSGGLLNVVWRVPLASGSVVAKIAPPFVAALPDVPLDPARQRVEAAALAAFAPGGPLADLAGEAVRPPRPLHHSPEDSVLVMEDVGDVPSLDAALADRPGGAAAWGKRLGRFVGRLHAVPVTDALRAAFENPAAQETRLEVQYRSTGDALRAAGVPDADSLGAEAVALGERFLERGRCLIQGDLWPPSVLVTPDGLRVIDWELAHVGVPAQDLGHLGAHLWMLAHRTAAADAARAAWAAFLEGYVEGVGPERSRLLAGDAVSDAVRHLGCEVLARAVGPFTGGSAYDGLAPDAAPVCEAAVFAARALRQPDDFPLFDALR